MITFTARYNSFSTVASYESRNINVQREMLGSIRETKKACVSIKRRTKFSLEMYLYTPNNRGSLCIALIPKGCEELMYVVKTEHNPFGPDKERYYLRVGSTQGVGTIVTYIKSVLNGYNIDECNVELVFQNNCKDLYEDFATKTHNHTLTM